MRKHQTLAIIVISLLIAALFVKRVIPNFSHEWPSALSGFLFALLFILILIFYGRKDNKKRKLR